MDLLFAPVVPLQLSQNSPPFSLFTRCHTTSSPMNIGRRSAMRNALLIAAIVLGFTGVNAQSAPQTNSQSAGNVQPGAGGSGFGSMTEGSLGLDPLSVPTSTLPTRSESFGPAGSTGSAAGTAATSADGSTSGISASSMNRSQEPLQLPGETPDTLSSQAATTTAVASGRASGTICPPPVPATDGGSAHIAEIAGASLGGC